MKSIHPYILIASSPVLPGFLSWREVWEDVGFPILSGLPEAMSWRDAKSRDLRPAIIVLFVGIPSGFPTIRCHTWGEDPSCCYL